MPKRTKRPAVLEPTVNVPVPVPASVHAKLKALAAEQDTTVSSLFRESVAAHLKLPEILAVARPGNFTATDKPRSRD
jgi:hypothetical protein